MLGQIWAFLSTSMLYLAESRGISMRGDLRVARLLARAPCNFAYHNDDFLGADVQDTGGQYAVMKYRHFASTFCIDIFRKR